MDTWVHVVTTPLGLVAFALFVVFSALAKIRARAERRVFIALAALTLVTTVGVAAWLALQPTPVGPTAPKTPPIQAPNSSVSQSTTGNNSPAIANVGGSVRIDHNDGDHK
jgi:hypothetical protein